MAYGLKACSCHPLNSHKSICYFKAQIMRIIRIPSNAKYTGLHICHIGCKYDFFEKKCHPYMPLIPTNCNLLKILTFSDMKGTIYASKLDQLVMMTFAVVARYRVVKLCHWIKHKSSQDALVHHSSHFWHTYYGFLSVFPRIYKINIIIIFQSHSWVHIEHTGWLQ